MSVWLTIPSAKPAAEIKTNGWTAGTLWVIKSRYDDGVVARYRVVPVRAVAPRGQQEMASWRPPDRLHAHCALLGIREGEDEAHKRN